MYELRASSATPGHSISCLREPAGRRTAGAPAEKRREGRLLTSKGQVVVVLENDRYRANDEASFAREQLQRTFGFAMGSDAVFVLQVEAYTKDFVDLFFADTSLTFSEFVWGLLNFCFVDFFVLPRLKCQLTGLASWKAQLWYLCNDEIHFQHRVYR